MFIIPSGIFQTYYDICDDILSNNYLSGNYTLYYPPLKTSCSNCVTGFFGGISKNVYKHGGPAPFESVCPLCGGNGYKEIESTDSVRLRVYYNPRDWIKIANLNIPKAEVMIIGFMSDIVKIERMNEILLDVRYRLSSKPVPHGFGKNRYFISFLERV